MFKRLLIIIMLVLCVGTVEARSSSGTRSRSYRTRSTSSRSRTTSHKAYKPRVRKVK